MLEETLAEWRDQAIKEGLQKGRQEGRLEGRRDTLLKLMTSRFGPLPEEARRQVEQITSEKELERLSRKVLSAKSLEDMRIRAMGE